MQTIYDWITVGLFCALIAIFLQRSAAEHEVPGDRLIHYLAPTVGCAIANALGNDGQHLWAIMALIVTFSCVIVFVKPFSGGKA